MNLETCGIVQCEFNWNQVNGIIGADVISADHSHFVMVLIEVAE